MSNRNPGSNKKNPKMKRAGKLNGRWRDGRSKTFYRKEAGAKKGEVVHHKDHNKSNSKKSNLKIIKPGKNMSAAGKHNQSHPEKGGRR